ncbi:MAG: NPCBM/NEW2 domain-containing protein [Kiritimatiellia bacterium]
MPLTELAPVSEQQGYGSPGLDHNLAGGGLRIAGRSFEHGLATHAASRIVYALGGKGARFTAFVGVDAAMSGYRESSVIFQVTGDGKLLFDSGVMKINTPAKPVDVDLAGVKELALVVTDAGDGNYCDHADWADAMVHASAELARRPPPPAAVPLAAAGTLGAASVRCGTNEMTVSTGVIERTWKWTGRGLVTTGLRDLRSGVQRAKAPARACDWDLPGLLNDSTPGVLIGSTVRESDDEGFSGRHLEVVNTIRYEQARLQIQHVVWVFPGAPGLRTQIRARALPGFDPKGLPDRDGTYTDCGATFLKPGPRADYLPLDFTVANERLYWGYYNNPGNRHEQSQDMLREQVVKGWPVFLREDIDWASGMAVKYGESGVITVKESPKCVNQPAHNTGAFFSGPQGVSITGWGLTPAEIVPDRFREGWADWTIVYQGGDDGLQRALKQFDAARYPVNVKRDAFILSNTWGPANPGGAQFTAEDFVLKEFPLLADLGVDVLQIDDGWQKSGGGPGASGFLPKYKDGWKNIKAAADKTGVRLGLWVAIRNASLADLKKDLDELGFITWKVDFDHLSSRADYEARIAKYRELMKYSPDTQFTLCPEYDDPRYGWYFAKEYGSIYFQNIQEGKPAHLTMVPFHVLRQHWLMAKYFPANKLQVMLQNPKRTRKDISDASLHSHAYCFAMGLPFVPEFFQCAQFLDEEGRKELKALIAIYKAARGDIFTSLTYPVGDLPDNASWSGFQMESTTRPGGHLLLFRELHNPDAEHTLKLKFLAGRTLALTDLRTGAKNELKVGPDGTARFAIQQPADFRLYRYEPTPAPAP